MTVRVYIIEPHSMIRAGLRATLAQLHGVEIAGEADSGPVARKELASSFADVTLLDGGLAEEDDYQLVRDLSLLCAAVVVLSDTADTEAVVRATEAGAQAFASKTVDRAELGRLIEAASSQRGPEAGNARNGRHWNLPDEVPDPQEVLSPRELEVFRMTGEGEEAKEIAQALGLSPRTVDVHRNNIRNKLGIRGTHDLMRFAMQWLTQQRAAEGLRRFRDEKRPLMLVEDDAVDILSVKRAMRQLRPETPLVVKRHGEEALEYLRRPENPLPFLILLDLNMPRMRGQEFLTEVRQDPQLATLPVVVLTGSRQEEDKRDMHALHLMGYMVKPQSSTEFLDLFSSLARFWSATEPPPSTQPVLG